MLKTVKVVGLNLDTEAALANVFQSSSAQALDKGTVGEANLVFAALVYCVLDDAFTRSRQALAEAAETFFLSPGALGERLKEAFETIKKTLGEEGEVQILLGTAQEEENKTTFYLIHQGEKFQALLQRDGQSSDLCTLEQDGEILSGFLKEGDRVVMATKSLEELLALEKKSLDTLPLESIEDEVAAMFSEERLLPLAAVILEKEPQIKVEEQISPVSVTRTPPFVLKLPAMFKFLPHHFNRRWLLVGIGVMLVVGLGGGLLIRQLKNSPPKSTTSQQPPSTPPLEQANVIQVQEIPLWLDLDLIKKDFTSQRLSLSHGQILVLDTTNKTLLTVSLNKSPQILAGKEKLGEAKFASLNGDLAWILSEDKGLVRVDLGNKETEVVIKPDEKWKNISEIFGFANNIYLLDSGQVWKYLPIAAGYSEAREYLQKETKADFSSVKRFQIDGSVWVLKTGGEILKFTQGVPDSFALSGLGQNIKDPQSFYVSDETENLYLLDGGNNRLLVLDKKGNFVAQYESESFSQFTDLIVQEKERKVYLLEGSKIFVMDLR